MKNGVQRLLESNQEHQKRVGRGLIDALDKLKHCVQHQLVDSVEPEAERRELAIGREILAELGKVRHDESDESSQALEHIRQFAQELVNIHSPGGAEGPPAAQG